MSVFDPHYVLPEYRPNGQPARALILIKDTLQAGDTVTVNGDDYVFGLQFSGPNASRASQSLVAAIRGQGNETYFATSATVFRDYSAYEVGPAIVVFATAPGTAGNAYTLVSNTPRISVSDATFTGGAAPTSTSGSVTVQPNVTGAGNTSVTLTNTVVALASQAAAEVTFVNNSGKTIGVTRGGTGAVFPLLDGMSKTFEVLVNANELSVQNSTDSSSITTVYEWVKRG